MLYDDHRSVRRTSTQFSRWGSIDIWRFYKGLNLDLDSIMSEYLSDWQLSPPLPLSVFAIPPPVNP